MAFFRAKAGQRRGKRPAFALCWNISKFKKAFRYYIKQIDSMLPCVCSVIDHRRRQNVVRTSVTHSATPHVRPLVCSYHILTSSVIYYWTDARQHGIYLLILYSTAIGPFHDPVTWYGINYQYAGAQVIQWHFQNKGTRTSPVRLSLF